jgi:hypothetical protein
MTFRPYNVIIQQAVDASSSSSTGLTYTLENQHGSPVAAFLPVCSANAGGFKRIDVSNETDSLSVIGVTRESILNATEGPVVGFGRLTDITTAFALNSTIWVSKTGELTDTAPDVGVGGFESLDYVIKIGKIVKNQEDSLKKDLIINIKLVGQLI